MNSSDRTVTTTLRFHGKTAKECNEFVEAVINHAFAEGKSRDDEWIADFVATRMSGDALRWRSGLDDATQRSWRKLQQAMFSRYCPVFDGKSGEEAEEFVRSVRQAATGAGKENDNAWIASFVSNSLAGNALRWHLSLDRSVRDDWDLLQAAILDQYPREGGFQDTSQKVPTPASAAPAPAMPSKIQKYRIRTCRTDSSDMLFLTKEWDRKHSNLKLAATSTNALIVECDTSEHGQQQLRIPTNQLPGFDRLICRWKTTSTTSPFSYADALAMNSLSGTVMSSTSDGALIKEPWRVMPASLNTSNFKLEACYAGQTLVPVTNNNISGVWFRGQNGPIFGETKMELFLEPI